MAFFCITSGQRVRSLISWSMSKKHFYVNSYLEQWLYEVRYTFCDPMTYDEYLLMRTARLTMMRTMLRGIPGIVDNGYPSLWYTFGTMGDLLDALNTWTQRIDGQMGAANDFFNNPQWLPIHP